MIWISHLHADHHLGTVSIIKAWYEEVYGEVSNNGTTGSIADEVIEPSKVLEDERRLFVVGGRDMIKWLKEYSSVEDYGYKKIVPLESIVPHGITKRAHGGRSFLKWHDKRISFGDPNSTDASL